MNQLKTIESKLNQMRTQRTALVTEHDAAQKGLAGDLERLIGDPSAKAVESASAAKNKASMLSAAISELDARLEMLETQFVEAQDVAQAEADRRRAEELRRECASLQIEYNEVRTQLNDDLQRETERLFELSARHSAAGHELTRLSPRESPRLREERVRHGEAIAAAQRNVTNEAERQHTKARLTERNARQAEYERRAGL
jgi:ElaB/YqjD/DUF883 family membrane-anchored ribosome-binding protein